MNKNKMAKTCYMCHQNSRQGTAVFVRKGPTYLVFCSMECYHQYKEDMKARKEEVPIIKQQEILHAITSEYE